MEEIMKKLMLLIGVLFLILGTANTVSAQETDARAYFQQIYNAGGFFTTIHTAEGTDIITSNEDWVCYEDNPRAIDFVVFKTMSFVRLPQKHLPSYVGTVSSDELLNMFPADLQTFFRDGGAVLDQDVYVRGVKGWSVEYQWDGEHWFAQGTKATVYFNIEPSTMRWLQVAETGNEHPFTGWCEHIPEPKNHE
jgi:hypothetical protein